MKQLAFTYTRAPETRNEDAAYEQKFAALIELCKDAKPKKTAECQYNILIRWPWVIGDTYEELIQSLSCIAEAGLALHITEGQTAEPRPTIPPFANN